MRRSARGRRRLILSGLRRLLPPVLATLAAFAALILAGPPVVAGAVLRFSSDAQGPSSLVLALAFLLVFGLAALAGLAGWTVGRLLLRLSHRR